MLPLLYPVPAPPEWLASSPSIACRKLRYVRVSYFDHLALLGETHLRVCRRAGLCPAWVMDTLFGYQSGSLTLDIIAKLEVALGTPIVTIGGLMNA